MKTCIKCGLTEDQTTFPKDKNQCKECLKQYRKTYHIKNKEKTHATQKVYYELNKNAVLQYQKSYSSSGMGEVNH